MMKLNEVKDLLVPVLWLALWLIAERPVSATPQFQTDSANSVCDDLTQTGTSLYYQSHYIKALEQFHEAFACYQSAGDRANEGVTLNNIGLVYTDQGRYAEALDNYQAALLIAREVSNRANEGVTLNNIGLVYTDQGRYAEALDNYQAALLTAREVGDRTGEGVTLNNIGLVYIDQGRYAEALDNYHAALLIAREVGDRTGEGTILNNIGAAYRGQCRYAEALASHQAALVIHREVGNRAEEGSTLNSIGAVYDAQDRITEALDNYQAALLIAREVGDRAGEGVTLNNIGGMYEAQGRTTQAVESYQAALLIFHEVGHRAGEGTTLNNIGLVYTKQGYYAEALESHQAALLILHEMGHWVGEGTTLNNIGGVYQAQESYAEALDYYQQALSISQEMGDRAGEGVTLSNIGLVYQAQGRYDEALDSYEQAIMAFEDVRAVAGSEEARSSFIAQHAHLYDRTVSLYHQQGQNEDAFLTAERGRARAFLDSLATGYVQLSDNEATKLLNQEQEAYTQRQVAQDALAKAKALNPPDPNLVADLEAQLAEAEKTYADAQSALEARSDQLADLVPGRNRVLGVKEVQALLDEQTSLISYFILDDQILAFLLTPDAFQVIDLDISREELTDRVKDFREAIELKDPTDTHAIAQDLYNSLIAPLASHLNTPRLLLIPHGPLHYLPFVALQNPETGQYLVQNYTLLALPNASALPYVMPARTAQAEDFASPLIVGNPTSGDFDAVASLATERAGLDPLPFAEKEVQTIAALYGVEPLIGQAATESAVREQTAQAGLLHLAAHGYYNPVAPLNSLIALAPDNPKSEIENPKSADGWLTVGEIYGLDLSQTDLVVLSACQTQLGELSAGDELVGLTRAFFFARTPTVVASLWNVDDAATAFLMERFYTHLQAGMSKAAALRQAQLDTWAKYPEPYYWAAFVLSGDGGDERRGEIIPLPHWLQSPMMEMVLIVIAGVLAVVAIPLSGVAIWLWWRQKSGLPELVGVQPASSTEHERINCQACQTFNDPDAHFCTNCGHPLSAPRG